MYRLPDRRRHVRILTLKNFGWTMLALVVIFTVISIRSEFTSSEPRPGEYGRLYGHEVPPVDTQAPPEVVHEEAEPVDDQAAADPMLIEPAAREQWLHAEASAAAPTTATLATTVTTSTVDGTHVAIVGGPEGVSVVHHERARPQLSGGFGRH